MEEKSRSTHPTKVSSRDGLCKRLPCPCVTLPRELPHPGPWADVLKVGWRGCCSRFKSPWCSELHHCRCSADRLVPAVTALQGLLTFSQWTLQGAGSSLPGKLCRKMYYSFQLLHYFFHNPQSKQKSCFSLEKCIFIVSFCGWSWPAPAYVSCSEWGGWYVVAQCLSAAA